MIAMNFQRERHFCSLELGTKNVCSPYSSTSGSFSMIRGRVHGLNVNIITVTTCFHVDIFVQLGVGCCDGMMIGDFGIHRIFVNVFFLNQKKREMKTVTDYEDTKNN